MTRSGPRFPERPDDGRKRLGPHSALIERGALGGRISGTSREGKFLLAYEKMLIDYLGGNPSIVQRAIITRASRIALHLELLDERVFCDGHGLTQHDYQHYCAWSNSLTRMLTGLGVIEKVPAQRGRPRKQSLASVGDQSGELRLYLAAVAE